MYQLRPRSVRFPGTIITRVTEETGAHLTTRRKSPRCGDRYRSKLRNRNQEKTIDFRANVESEAEDTNMF
ncbi:hypothetical protein E2C01_082754 [Portunus trituberculatus]|uniref:Uncharacterized protein n=1 Tax=Portunus trituberculatus TaxID=210409 RepID=A0A5B7J5Z9_PORTR|nr:hypothetical protein [Portunus trituberculatus]